MRNKSTKLEQAVERILTALGVDFYPQYPIGIYAADFYVPSRRLVIECDGDYWHNRPETKAKDMKRDAWLTARGYNVLRFPEGAIRRGWHETVLTRMRLSA